MGAAMTVLVDAIVVLGMAAVLPLGLALLGGPAARAARWWPVAAVPGALSLLLPRGPGAAALAVLYAAATAALAALAPLRLARTRSFAPAEVAALTALTAPLVAGTALVAERAGHPLLGFGPGILALTVPHFHFAGFTAALVAGLACRAAPHRTAARTAALCVPAGTLLVLAGYFVDDLAELAGAVVLTAGMWLTGLVTWQEIRPRTADRTTRTLLGTGAAVLAATMLLALWWALGEATGIVHPTLAWMAATHGLGNALGFALCTLLALHRLRENP